VRKSSLVALFLIAPMTVQAGVYSCDVDGRKVYQSTPCNAGDVPLAIERPVGIETPAGPEETRSIEEIKRELAEKRARNQQIKERRAEEARRNMEIKQAIRGRDVIVGMNKDEVLSAWGRPDNMSSSLDSGFAMEHWIYSGRYYPRHVYFKNGVVISVTE
jgi:hypothetical protein